MVNLTQESILITGGAGYIGSHTAYILNEYGYKVVILDNLSCGHKDIVEERLKLTLIIGEISDRKLLRDIFKNYKITSVIHFAADAYVAESVRNPIKYYQNNVRNSLILLEEMVRASIKFFVFSSSCTTYGVPSQLPVSEEHVCNPISPYGFTKLAVERMLLDFDKAYGLKSISLRYFNAAGAHPDALLGEDHQPETHLIPSILLTALGKRDKICINGVDYPTADGTCVRDYTHVMDLAEAHRLGLNYLHQGGETTICNVCNGKGFSVREVIDMAQEISGESLVVLEKDRRLGDPPQLIGTHEKAKTVLGWKPEYADLASIIYHAWCWHLHRHGS